MVIIELVKEYIDDELINLVQKEQKCLDKAKPDNFFYNEAGRKQEAISTLRQLKAFIEGLETK
jgi:hypothetical protein